MTRPRFEAGEDGLRDKHKHFDAEDFQETHVEKAQRIWGRVGLSGRGVSYILLAFVAVVGLIMYAHYNNREVRLKRQALAMEKDVQVAHDNMWKTLQDQLGVRDAYKDDFAQVFPQLMQAQNPQDGEQLMMKFVTQAQIPVYDNALNRQLFASIENKRAEFAMQLKSAFDVEREHNTLIDEFPSNLFVGRREYVNIKPITSTRSQEAQRTGRDDETLFPQKK